MKKNLLMMLTMLGIICLSSFTNSKEENTSHEINSAKSKPSFTLSYPSEFSRLLNLNLKKSVSQTKKTKVAGPVVVYFWWDFNGGDGDMGDPGYYSLDPDNFPECLTVSGYTYCEIRAQASSSNDQEPDLQTINGTRFRAF